jgi:hypothetical protein
MVPPWLFTLVFLNETLLLEIWSRISNEQIEGIVMALATSKTSGCLKLDTFLVNSLMMYLQMTGRKVTSFSLSSTIALFVRCFGSQQYCSREKGEQHGCSKQKPCSFSSSAVARDMKVNSLAFYIKNMSSQRLMLKRGLMAPLLKANLYLRMSFGGKCSLEAAFRLYLSVVPPPSLIRVKESPVPLGYFLKRMVSRKNQEKYWKIFMVERDTLEAKITEVAERHKGRYINRLLSGDTLLVFLLRIWFLLPEDAKQNIKLVEDDVELKYTFQHGLWVRSKSNLVCDFDNLIRALVIASEYVKHIYWPPYGKITLVMLAGILARQRCEQRYLPICMKKQEKAYYKTRFSRQPYYSTVTGESILVASIEVYLKDGSKIVKDNGLMCTELFKILPAYMVEMKYLEKVHAGFSEWTRLPPKN